MANFWLYPEINVKYPATPERKKKRRRGKRTISDKTIRNIKKLYSLGIHTNQLALMFGIHESYCYRICNEGIRDRILYRDIG